MKELLLTSLLLCFYACAIPQSAVAQTRSTAGKAGDELRVTGQQENASAATFLPARLQVQESRISHTLDHRLFGLSYSWTSQMALAKDSLEPAQDFLDLAKGMPLPFNRIGGAEGQDFRWKQAVGPLAGRTPQTIKWAGTLVMRNGPTEWMRTVHAIDTDAQFVICLNLMKDSVQDNADLVEYLLGDGKTNPNGGENWAQKRVQHGQIKPLPVAIWEIGNELDWHKEASWSPEKYAERCREVIAAIRALDPKAKFAVHGATSPTSDKPRHFADREGGWVDWHRLMLKRLGSQIDYIVLHPYYVDQTIVAEAAVEKVRRDIHDITGAEHIGIFLSEHAYWTAYKTGLNQKSTLWRTHSLRGTLVIGQFLNKMIAQPNVIATTWTFSGGPWRAFGRDDKTGRPYYTGVAELLRVLNQDIGNKVVTSQLSGERTAVSEKDYSFSTSVTTTPDGLNLLLINREATAQRDLALAFEKKYRLVEEVQLSAESLDSHNTAERKDIKVSKRRVTDAKPLTNYRVPAKSLVVLKLKVIGEFK